MSAFSLVKELSGEAPDPGAERGENAPLKGPWLVVAFGLLLKAEEDLESDRLRAESELRSGAAAVDSTEPDSSRLQGMPCLLHAVHGTFSSHFRDKLDSSWP